MCRRTIFGRYHKKDWEGGRVMFIVMIIIIVLFNILSVIAFVPAVIRHQEELEWHVKQAENMEHGDSYLRVLAQKEKDEKSIRTLSQLQFLLICGSLFLILLNALFSDLNIYQILIQTGILAIIAIVCIMPFSKYYYKKNK